MSTTAPKGRIRTAWQQTPIIVALVILWALLWGSLSPLTVVSGLVVAVVVMRVFYLPPVELSGRFHLGWFLVFLGKLVLDLVVASVQVSLLAIRPTPIVKNSIISVQLLTRSDLIMTITAIALSLIPGSLVVDVDRGSAVLYLHVLNTPNREIVERERGKVLAIEKRVVRALGSRDDLQKLAGL
jgi:multicomponent Na+:H+ antiporter subunit E